MRAEEQGTRHTARTAAALLQARAVPAGNEAEIEEVRQRYAVAVTPAMLDLIDPTDIDDPIARQFVPRREELDVTAEERRDPIGDEPHTKVSGITHRYPDRLLLKPLHVCPVYCRFCFRREYVGPGGEMLTKAELERALDYVREHSEVWEVILTGGDPLLLSPRRLLHIMGALADIEHVAVVRVHTRVPVVDPERVTDDMVAALRRHTPTYVVLHSNHPREMTPAASQACARLVDGGIPMLSQSVLLRGVNDDPATLESLFRTLVRNRVKPYYLHQGDLAQGTSHFRTSIADGQALMRALRGDISGICQPTYVLDLPGGFGKSPIGPNYLERQPDETWSVEDFRGRHHTYPPSPA
jgi:lysine 2,3-aminomutase